MKKYALLLVVAISFGLMSFNNSKGFPFEEPSQQQEVNQVEVPENIQVVLDRSCLPCHGQDGSTKARVKWKYEKMSDYSKSKLVSKYIKIFEKVDEGKMPPSKDVKKHPERSLSDEEKILLKTWAENAAVQLVGEEE